MRLLLLLVYMLFSISLADELVVGTKKSKSFYKQETEFLVAKGDSVVGPIDLLPYAEINSLIIKNDNPDLKILTYLIEPASLSWKKNLIGKTISYEGNGRILKGIVRDISDNFITIETKRGTIVTTLPKFPSKISSQFSWKELFSPKITIRMSSNVSNSVKLNIIYPMKNISWKPYYVLKVKNQRGKFYSYYVINNDTQIYFNNIDISIQRTNGKPALLAEKASLPPFSQKRIEMYSPKIVKTYNGALIGKEFPNGDVIIYKDNILLYGKIVNGHLRLKK